LISVMASAWPARKRLHRLLENGAMLLVPMGCGVAVLLLYNKLRFDDWFNVGINYQTTTLKFRMSPHYWLTNIYSYTLRPFFPECRFPYLIAPAEPGARAFPNGTAIPEGYLLIEPLVGWLRAVPLTWLVPILPLAVAQRLRMWRTRGALGPAEAQTALNAKPRTFLWLVLCLTILASLSGIPAMGLYMGTMRYLADFTNALVLLGILGGFWLYSSAAQRRLRFASALFFAAPAVATICIGLLLGYQGYVGHFKTYNPELDQVLVSTLSFCEAPPPATHPRHTPAKRRH
jgi:hypothetical protein